MYERMQPSWQYFSPGDVVTFLNEYLFDKNNIIVSGMLGEVYPDFYGTALHENGVMAIPLGASEPFAYPSQMVRKVIDDPSGECVTNALALYEYRFEVFEARVGWTGYVKIKNHIFKEKRIKGELQNTVKLVLKGLRQNKDTKPLRGHVRRIEKILNGFHRHPASETPLQLARALTESKFDSSEISSLLKQAYSWSLEPDAPPCISV